MNRGSGEFLLFFEFDHERTVSENDERMRSLFASVAFVLFASGLYRREATISSIDNR